MLALHLLGIIANAVGKLDIVKKLLKAAIQTSPNTTLFHANIAEILRKMGNLKRPKCTVSEQFQLTLNMLGL